jgi:hypothetical protein
MTPQQEKEYEDSVHLVTVSLVTYINSGWSRMPSSLFPRKRVQVNLPHESVALLRMRPVILPVMAVSTPPG